MNYANIYNNKSHDNNYHVHMIIIIHAMNINNTIIHIYYKYSNILIIDAFAHIFTYKKSIVQNIQHTPSH